MILHQNRVETWKNKLESIGLRISQAVRDYSFGTHLSVRIRG